MTRARQLIVLLLTSLLALQSVLAVAAPCDMAVTDHSQMAMDSGEHAGHQMPAMDTAPDGNSASCCGEGYCSQNGCLSISLMTHTAHGTELLPGGYSHFSLKTTVLDPFPDSQLRPPSA